LHVKLTRMQITLCHSTQHKYRQGAAKKEGMRSKEESGGGRLSGLVLLDRGIGMGSCIDLMFSLRLRGQQHTNVSKSTFSI